MATKKPKPRKRITSKNQSSNEFLIQTLASIQSALTSIDKEASAKTEALGAVLENVNGMSEMMRLFHEQNIRDAAKITELDSEIRALRTETRLLNSGDDIKEIKQKLDKINDEKLQKISEEILTLKTVKQTTEELKGKSEDDGDKKWNIITFLKEFIVGLNNLKTILIVVLVIIMLVGSLFYGPAAIQNIIDILKNISL